MSEKERNDLEKLRYLQTMSANDFDALYEEAKKDIKSDDGALILQVMFKILDKRLGKQIM